MERGIYPDGSNADFYTTGLRRTEQTMEIIYGKREHEILPQLKEMNFGDYEMKSFYRWIPDPGHGYILYMEDEDVLGVEKF